MQVRSHLTFIAAAVALLTASVTHAQDLTITNARILDGTGRVIERGAIVVRAGKIVSVSATAPTATAGGPIRSQRLCFRHPGLARTVRFGG